MNDTPDDHEAEYAMVMPFVVVTSNGGPYDDQAFVAGCRFGDLARLLRSLPPEVQEFDHVEYVTLLPQVDLLAMSEGWTVGRYEDDDGEAWADEWARLSFKRVEPPS